jgi:hypothetical protein
MLLTKVELAENGASEQLEGDRETVPTDIRVVPGISGSAY